MESTLISFVHQLGTLEFWQTLLESFGDLGPLAPIFLAMVESFFPPLPLIAIVALNVAAHGGLFGFVYSWVGVMLGGTLMFLAAGAQTVLLEVRQPFPEAGKSGAVGQPVRRFVPVHAVGAAVHPFVFHALCLRHLGL